MSFFSSPQSDEMEYLYSKIPDVKVIVTDSLSRNISYWYSQKPMLLTLAYSRCPGVCNPYLLQIRDQVSLLGKEENSFQVIVLSFDPEDDPVQLRKLAGFSDDVPLPANWTFGVLDKESNASLLPALGIQTQSVDEIYDHNTVLTLIDKDGKILQRIEGLPDNEQWIRLFKELTNDFIPVYSTLSDNVWTSCFQYDPASGTWKFNWGLLLILAPSICTLLLLILLHRITSHERKMHSHSPLIQKQS